MESGDPLPSASGGASPSSPNPPPPPPTGWLAGLVSGAGRILASVLGPDSSGCGSGSTSSSAASDGKSPSASCSPVSSRPPGEGPNGGADHGDSLLVSLKNNQINQCEGETMLKDYAGSLAIVSEIEPKDAIVQLLMQETYSRSEGTKFIKIIQERILDSDSGTISKLTHTDQSPFTHKAGNIQHVLKRSCSVREDAYEEVRRVRPKINGNPLNIPKFKQVDMIRNHPGVGDQINYGTTVFNRCSNKDLKKGFPLKVEPLNAGIPFEQQMMDFSHQKQEHDVSNDSCSLSKLMLKEDIDAASSLQGGIQLQNGYKSRRRRQPNSQKTTPTPTSSPAKGSRRKNNAISVKSEMDLLEQSKLVLTEQEPPELGDIRIPKKRPVGRPRKAK